MSRKQAFAVRHRPARTAGHAVLGGALLLLLTAGCGSLACGGSGGPSTADSAPDAESDSGMGTSASAAVDTAPDRARPAAGEHAHVPTLSVHILASHPHQHDAFTQGLLWHDGVLYESTGQHGQSSLRKVDLETGKVLEQRDLPEELFGEGLALIPGDRLVQLTWQSGVALVWSRKSFARLGEHTYPGEGWGLTYDGKRLVMSDGSSWLTFRDPDSFEELSRVQVTLDGRPLSQLNELEWVDGSVWANVWGATEVVRIDPTTGKVTAMADLGVLYGQLDPREAQGIDVLNGIAYRPPAAPGEDGVFLVTGKYWPRLFEVVFEPPAAAP